MTDKKYELTDDTMVIGGCTLHRIRALRSFGNVIKGELGGFIESEANLSHRGNCWVSDEATVLQNARVMHNAQIRGNANVYGDAQVYWDAQVCEDAKVCGNAWVMDNANVGGNAWVMDNANVGGNAYILHPKDLIVIGPLGSRNDRIAACRNKNGGIEVATGCFHGTLEEFKKRVKRTHGENRYGKEYQAAIAFIKKFFSIARGLD